MPRHIIVEIQSFNDPNAALKWVFGHELQQYKVQNYDDGALGVCKGKYCFYAIPGQDDEVEFCICDSDDNVIDEAGTADQAKTMAKKYGFLSDGRSQQQAYA